MGWIAQLTGHVEAVAGADAEAAERAVAADLQAVARGLTDLGHEGVAATFTGDHVGAINLLAEPAPAAVASADALGGNTPQPPAEGETQPANQAVADGTPAPIAASTTDDEAAEATDEAAEAAAAAAQPGYVAPIVPPAGA